MTNKQIIIDGVDIKDCKRRKGKDNYRRYYKRPCSENNYNCIWKKYLRKEQECKEFKQTLIEIKEIAEVEIECKTYEIENDCFNETRCKALNEHIVFTKQILQKISECEGNDEHS